MKTRTAVTAIALGFSLMTSLLMASSTYAQVGTHSIVIEKPPTKTPSAKLPDGAILGNGDVGITFAGNAANHNFYISKGDFWTEDKQILLGGINFNILKWNTYESGITNWVKQALKYRPSFHQELDIETATLVGRYASDDTALRCEAYLSATDNLFVVSWENQGKSPLAIASQVWSKTLQASSPARVNPGMDIVKDIAWGKTAAPPTPVNAGIDGEVFWVKRGTAPIDTSGRYTEAIIAARVLKSDYITQVLNPTSSGRAFIMDPGETVTIIVSIESLGSPKPSKSTRSDYPHVFETLDRIESKKLNSLRQDHVDWWQQYWQLSSITLEDKILERYWYESLYVMASASREGKAAPGLFFWVTTDNPAWKGDYHLNYNFQAPYYGMYSSNRPDIVLPYYRAMLDQIENGRRFAKGGLYTNRSCDGIVLPPGIGPAGRIADMNHVGQLSHATESALPFLKYFYYTQDRAFLKDVAYPYLVECAKFWEDYLRKEGGRYVVYSSGGDEKHHYDDFNAVKATAFIKALFKGLLVVGDELDVDPERVAVWKDIYENIATYPTLIHNNKEVIPYAESSFELYPKGRPYGMVGVSPADDISLSSDPRLLKRAQNTLVETDAWHYICETFPIAARLGYHPDSLIEKFSRECLSLRQPNGTYSYGAGGIETCGAIETINSMLLQSHEGFLRLFPVWPRDKHARFNKLRTYGAFLVSSEIGQRTIEKIEILSEKGNECRILNPWGNHEVKVFSNHEEVRSTIEEDMIVFQTIAGGEYVVRPEEIVRIQDPEYFQNFGGEIAPIEDVAESDSEPIQGIRLQAEEFTWSQFWWSRLENVRDGYLSCVNKDEFVVFENVDFGDQGLTKFVARSAVHHSHAGQEILIVTVDRNNRERRGNSFPVRNILIAPDLSYGRIIGTLKTKSTGGYSKYETQETNIEAVSGIQDLYIYFKGNGMGNFDWFEFR